MIATSLRVRLLLVVLTAAVPMGAASLAAFRIHADTRRQVDSLRPRTKLDLDDAAIVGRTLSIEGRWDSERAAFAAEELEELPWSRRPKLRGAVQSFDAASGRLAMLGVEILVGPEADLALGPDVPAGLAGLEAGVRAEVSCQVDRDGTWHARKIRVGDLKPADKIKGTITSAAREASGERRLSIEGLPIRAPAALRVASPRGPLHRLELASQLAGSAQECLGAAHEVLRARYLRRDARAAGDAVRAGDLGAAVDEAEERVEDGAQSFRHGLAALRADTSGAPEGVDAPAASLAAILPRFDQHLARFQDLAAVDLNAAGEHLRLELEPSIRSEVLPLVHACEVEAEEELSERLRAVSARSALAERLAQGAIAGGLALALALGLLVARSIARPMGELASAARRVGAGNLATRVEVRAQDEIGLLAGAFNRMAEALAASTVSVENLSGVLDAMAGALFLLGPDRRIASANPAALALLGTSAGDLTGAPFETIAPGGGDPAASGERALRARGGRTIPVSFAGAALRDERGAVRGYVCLAQDLTARRQMEEELRRSLSEKELLLREVHHRVKNNLQVISSLLDLQSRTLSDPRALEKFQESQDRIRSMVLIHDQLHRARDVEAIDMPAYLGLLVRHLEESHAAAPGRVRLRLDVDDVRLDLDRALASGLIVNELVTNAYKHAFAAGAAGEIQVALRLSGDGQLSLAVADDGPGLAASADGANGASLGMSLVEALARQLRGRLRSGDGRGTAFRVEFPFERAAEGVSG